MRPPQGEAPLCEQLAVNFLMDCEAEIHWIEPVMNVRKSSAVYFHWPTTTAVARLHWLVSFFSKNNPASERCDPSLSRNTCHNLRFDTELKSASRGHSVPQKKGRLMTSSEIPRKISMLVVAATAAFVCFAAKPDNWVAAQDIAPRPAALHLVTLVVSDIEQSMDFYLRLGLVSFSDTARTSNAAAGIISGESLPLTDDPTRSRLVVMATEGAASGTIALLWYDRPPLPSARGNLMGIGTGDVLLMFQVPDIQAAYGRLDSVSTRFHQPLTRFVARDEGGELQSGRRMLAYDPDGHLVEITQFD